MALETSAVCALESFDLWGLPPVQDTIEDTTVTEHRPLAPLDSSRVIEFTINTAEDEYILWKESYIYFKIRVNLGKEGVTAADWNKICPVNNLLHSMISQVDMTIANNTITTAPQTHAYKAYFETLLGFDDSAKKSHLTAALWYKDRAGEMNLINNPRRKLIAPDATGDQSRGKWVELMGRLHIDLAFQPRAFIGGSTIQLKLVPQKPEFYLLCTDPSIKPSVEFDSAVLHIRRVRVNPQIVVAHQQALRMRPAKYPLTRAEVKRSVIHAGQVDPILENVVTGQLPRRIFVAFVKNSAFNGQFDKNPFNFELFGLNFLCCYVNGYGVPSIPYQPHDKLTLREYYGLMDALNQNDTSTYCDIDRDEFNKGYAIFGFNFAPDLSDGCGTVGHVNPIKRGALRIQATFNTALAEPITVLTYCEFDSMLQIDSDRNPIVDTA